MQSDPIGLEGGENSFVYVGDNPLVRVDESGEISWKAIEAQDKIELMQDVWDAGALDTYKAGTVLKNKAEQSAKNFALLIYKGNRDLASKSIHNGIADAYRHCVWSCLMTLAFGEEDAKEIAYNHEVSGLRHKQPILEGWMDTYNNAIGRECAMDGLPMTCDEKCKYKALNGILVKINQY